MSTSVEGRMAHIQQPHRLRMSEFASRFPCLRAAPGVVPFEPEVLAAWSKKASHGEACAARFILGVWSGDGKFPGIRPFNFYDAMGVWDRDCREAFMAWVKEPYWP